MADRRSRPPLDWAALTDLAAGYAARYATTRAKLRRYLLAKLRARGWTGAEEPDLERLIERLATAGALDDDAWAEARTGTLSRRGYGRGRIGQALAAGGIGADRRAALVNSLDAQAAAEAYARRRRLGRFAPLPRGPDALRRDLAAMMRAGHGWAEARAALGSLPDDDEPG